MGAAGDDVEPPDTFEARVEQLLLSLRPGEVVTYGEVAAEAGHPGAARAVGRLLADSGGSYPWWRVVTVTGRLVPGHEVEHGERLEAEGVAVVDGRVTGMRWHRVRRREPPKER